MNAQGNNEYIFIFFVRTKMNISGISSLIILTYSTKKTQKKRSTRPHEITFLKTMIIVLLQTL